jgi:transcriptional regulator with XRE-family HTH domain
MALYVDKFRIKGHGWPMLKTAKELRQELGQAIRLRRIGQSWSQDEAATRAGMSLRTWKRMEADGPSLVENLIGAAIALRSEEGLSQLFPAPSASSLDELLKRQAAAAKSGTRKRAPRRMPHP